MMKLLVLETKLVLHYSQTAGQTSIVRFPLETKLVLHYSQTASSNMAIS